MTRAGWLSPALPLPLLVVLAGLAIAAVGPRLYPHGFPPGSTTLPARGQVEAAVRGHLYEWVPLADPLITLENGTQVKSSNVNGIVIGGERYFYRPVNSFTADPVGRGQPGDYQLVLVMDPGTQFETEVYRLAR